MRLWLILKSFFTNVKGEIRYLIPRESRYKPAVERYPDRISGRTPEDMYPKMRGFLMNDLTKCTGCGECIELCSVRALSMETTAKADGSLQVNNFKIDLGRCYSCSICVDTCPVGSIQYTTEYEGAVGARDGMVRGFLHADGKPKTTPQRMRTYEFRW
jgi:formate hydrogenlyase subunit 6/NADH:ubiquinone oxidoreductase subunit I